MGTAVQGLDKLERKLAAIPAAVRLEMRNALATNADELADMMRRLAPADTTKLRRSIGWRFATGGDDTSSRSGLRAGRAAQSVAKGNSELAVEVFAGDRERTGAYYARWVEYGTAAGVRKRSRSYSQGKGGPGLNLRSTASGGKKRTRKVYRTHPGTRAQPFFWPAYRALKRRMQSRLTRAMTKAIKQTAGGT